jgi:predicted RNase H-like HicB family nuclease
MTAEHGHGRQAYPEPVDQPREIELVFAPQEDGGYHVYAPDLPGLHTQGDTLEEATANAQEALELYVEGSREDGRSLDAGVIRRRLLVDTAPFLRTRQAEPFGRDD